MDLPKNPLVSVIIPAYNYAHFLDACIESALEHTYTNLEIIVVDDGSTDATPDVVGRYSQVRYYRQPRNGMGSSRAINRGIQEARGDLIAWLSADDRFVPEKIERQVAALKAAQALDPMVCMAYSDVFYEAPDEAGLRYCPLPKEERERQLSTKGYVRWRGNLSGATNDAILATSMHHNVVNGCTTLIDRRVFDAIGLLDESMPRSGDVEMWTRMMAHGYRFVFMPEPLIISRMHAENTSGWGEIPAEFNLVRRKLLERTPLERFYPQVTCGDPRSIQQAHNALGNALFEGGAFDAAAEEFVLAGLDETDSRLAKACTILPVPTDLPPLQLADAKATRFVMAFDETSDTGRCHLVLSHYLQAFGAKDDVSLVVWIPDSPAALEAFTHRFEAVCTALALDPDTQPHADVLVMVGSEGLEVTTYLQCLFAACHGFIPVAAPLDPLLFAIARQTNLGIAYEATVEGLRSLGAKIDPRAIDIVLLTHNRLDYLRKTVDALFARTAHPFRLTIVDNASDPAVHDYLQAIQPRCFRVVFNPDNRWTQAFSQGIALTRSDPFIVSDPDILVPDTMPCWLTQMLGLMNAHPEMGMLALNLDPSNKPAKMPDVYLGDKQPHGSDITLSNVGTVMQTIRRSYFALPYVTDWQAVETVRAHGGMVGFATNLHAYHLGWDEDRDYPDHLVNKYRYFRDNYGSTVYKLYTEDTSVLSAMEAEKRPEAPSEGESASYYGYARPEVQALVPASARRILDVGCAAGALGAALKSRQSCHVTGIEYVPEVARKAERVLDEVQAGDAIQLMAAMPSGEFDCIIFADVLEHMADPEGCLKEARRLLSPDGLIVLSLPNVRHWSVLRDLLEGRWEYQEAGILDRTHLRFFTRESMIRLLGDTGFTIQNLSGTVVSGFDVPAEVVRGLASTGIDVSTLESEGRIYQFLAAAAPTASKPVAELTSIVMLTWNQLPYTKLCIRSLFEHTAEPFELVVVDNGSTDGTVAYLQELAADHPNVKLILNASNRGFAGGCNQGIAVSSGRYVLLLNNDTVVYDGWLEGMLRAIQQEGVGLVGPRTNSIIGPQLVTSISYDPNTLTGFAEFARTWQERHRGQQWETHRVIGFCMLIDRAVIDRIGGLDTSFGRGNFEDDDYCLRAQLAGFRIAVADETFIHHFGSVTFRGQNLDYRHAMEENWVKFKRKWLLPSDSPLEKGYNFAEALALPYDPSLHSEPLFSAAPPPRELSDRRSFNIVVVEASEEQIAGTLTAYLDAFESGEDVALHILAGGRLDQIQKWVLETLEAKGRDPEQIPDVSLSNEPLSPLEVPGYLVGASVVVGSARSVQGARDMGIPATDMPDSEYLKLVRSRLRQVNWHAPAVNLPECKAERWLLSSPNGWEDALASFLGTVAPDKNVSLLIRTPRGEAESFGEQLTVWLTSHGYDPETIPDVLVLDMEVESEVSVFRAATAWVDNGTAMDRAIATSLGLPILAVDAMQT